jgi:hypothetical protein
MTSTKLVMALALLLSATSATLAKDRTYYDYGAVQSANSYNPTTSGYDPTESSQR